MSQRQQVTIKAKCKGVIRLLRIPKDLSYKGFYDLLKSSFGISQCQLQYSDEEGDLVELGSQEELQEAFKVGEKVGTLKVKLITTENPSMNALSKLSDFAQSNVMQGQSADTMHPEDSTVSSTRSPEVMAEQLSSLSINEKPTPKPRPNRKRMGFYTSLCSDIGEFENRKSSDKGIDSDEDVKQKKDPMFKKAVKHKKEAKPLRGSKYYSSLADEIAKMNSEQKDVDQQEGRKEMKRKAPSRKMEKAANDLPKKRSPSRDVKKVEKDMSEMSISDEEPPKWFGKVMDKMSQSVSSQVLGALQGNGAVIASIPANNGSPLKPLKRDGASYIHDGITCNGCQQTICGPRYKCGNCPDFDLCGDCELIEGIHDKSHVFLKLRYPGIGIGRRYGVMIPLLKDIIYKSDDVKLAEEQDNRMKEVRKKLKQMARKKREEQVRIKKAEKKMKKLNGGNSENPVCGLELELLGDGSYPDGTAVTPGFEFTKCWKIRNNGNVAWNAEVKLMYLYGPMRCISSNEAALPHLAPGEEGTVSATCVAPTEPGEYFSVWRASHKGRDFGSNMLCRIKVVEDETQPDDENETFVDASDVSVAPTQTDRGPDPEILNQQSPPTTQEPDPIFHAYTIQENHECKVDTVARNSSENQEATSDVSVLENMELEWDTCLMDDDTPRGIGRNPRNEDDAQDIEVISNASSDDFCVVPLPACFDPDIPLNIEGFENIEGTSIDLPRSLAEEMDREISLGSLVDNQDPSGSDEARSESTGNTNTQQDETMDPEDEDEDVRIIPVTPERPTTPEADLPEQAKSSPIPINIEMKSMERQRNNSLSMPGFDFRSTISEPVAPQPPSVERTPLIPGRLPASPPGRAVPVVQVQTSLVEKPTTIQYSVPGSFGVHVASAGSAGQTEEVQWRAVRTQPSDNVPEPVIEETVTIQPQAATSGSTAANTTQSTAQFASTLVTGTLKRAFGTVTDTVTSFMTGKDNPGSAHVVYIPGASGNNVHVVVPEIAEPVAPEQNRKPAGEPDVRVLMQQLQEMGFCDRQMNERLLKKYKMDVRKVVVELVQENDNEWSSGRH